jgi:hypothetical protein
MARRTKVELALKITIPLGILRCSKYPSSFHLMIVFPEKREI